MKEELLEAKEMEPNDEIEKKEYVQDENLQTDTVKENTEQKEVNINEEHKQENSENQTEKQEELKEDSKKTKKEKRKSKKSKKIIISVIIVIIIMLLFSTVFALTNMSNEKIISGVSIQGVEVSGLTKDEAIAKIQTTYDEKNKNNIMLQYQEFESELNPTLMEVSYNINKAVDEAYLIGRNSNIFANNYNILGTLIGKRNINVDMSLNEEATRQTINDIGANLPGIMIESGYSVEDDKLIVSRGKEGIFIDTEGVLTKVKDILKNIQQVENTIEVPVETKTPQPIDLDKIHSEIYKEAKDAYYTKDPFTVYPEVIGVDFDLEKAKELINAEVKDEYIIDLIITTPKVTTNDIGTEAFPDKLSSFTTRYNAGDRDRTTNLVIACKKINGKVLMPGETFSYNATLGPRTYSAGYKDAKVYEGGQVVDGIGGGICQISSTLYNAALMSDMEIVERRNHQFVTSYVSQGRDATVVYGSTDFKFKNTRKYPVRIVASANSGIATVSIFGIKEADREYTYSFKTSVISTIPYTTRYITDSSLATGKEVVTQKGANGLVCKTYMTKMLNGKVISTKLLSTDTYSAMQKIIKRGGTTTTQQKPTTTTTPSQTQPEQPAEQTKPTETTEPAQSTKPTEPEVETPTE